MSNPGVRRGRPTAADYQAAIKASFAALRRGDTKQAKAMMYAASLLAPYAVEAAK